MKSVKSREKTGRSERAGVGVKRVVVDLPKPLFVRAERATEELSINRSDLIREAVERYLKYLAEQKLASELVEGYRLNAGLDRAIAEEFSAVDYENF